MDFPADVREVSRSDREQLPLYKSFLFQVRTIQPRDEYHRTTIDSRDMGFPESDGGDQLRGKGGGTIGR